jgi:hypothetical protein
VALCQDEGGIVPQVESEIAPQDECGIVPQQVAVFSRTWRAARRAGQHVPHEAGVDVYFISVGERQPAQQVCIAKNSFPMSRASLRTFLRKLI